jgi:hypothetical protein
LKSENRNLKIRPVQGWPPIECRTVEIGYGMKLMGHGRRTKNVPFLIICMQARVAWGIQGGSKRATGSPPVLWAATPKTAVKAGKRGRRIIFPNSDDASQIDTDTVGNSFLAAGA